MSPPSRSGASRRVGLAATEQALDRLESLAGDAFGRTGSLRLAADDEEGEHSASSTSCCGRTASTPSGARSRRRTLSRAAMFHPSDAALQPARWVRRLAALAAEAGGDPRGQPGRVDRPVRRARVLVATDGYPSGLLGPLEGLIMPTRGQMIATEPLAERLFECPHYSRHGFDYWQQTQDGRILAGGFRDSALESEFTADEETTAPIQARSRPSSPTWSAGRSWRAPLGGDLRLRAGFPAGRRPRAGRRSALGLGWLLRPRQCARDSLRRARRERDARPGGARARPVRSGAAALGVSDTA